MTTQEDWVGCRENTSYLVVYYMTGTRQSSPRNTDRTVSTQFALAAYWQCVFKSDMKHQEESLSLAYKMYTSA